MVGALCPAWGERPPEQGRGGTLQERCGRQAGGALKPHFPHTEVTEHLGQRTNSMIWGKNIK